MKSILLSIKPKYVELIASGEKTIEVRKTAPQEVSFKAYIYCTNGEYSPTNCGKKSISDCLILNRNVVNGRVIGEFICDNVEKLEEHIEQGGLYYTLDNDFNEKAQLDNWELYDYGEGKTLYGWHVSDLKIYNKPRALSEFGKVGFGHEVPLKRPPQSYMYVEDLGEKK